VDRYICVHGHFYQPPRENPWLEVVEQQDAAYPFHDWNERITTECYGPNTRARILDDQGRITRLVNNYARMSFNIGPTLLAWMQDAAPDTYAGIQEADRRSAKRYGGHGSAMAQVFGHAIMPLLHPRDAHTQVHWGVTDFRHRFGRDPEGMWLAECAVDDATLELLVDHGIRFTVLSPYQAAAIRPAGAKAWQDVSGGRVDPTRPYEVPLPSGRSIAVFFYDGPISQAIAFEGLLEDAPTFERRLLGGFTGRAGAQLVHIATDGESYGHHHRHGEMALAAALHRLYTRDDVQVTNYAQFLELHPPDHQAQVVQASSWSCAHGVERWRSDCGCGSEPGRHGRWRAPLKAALDWLRDELADRYVALASDLLTDPWAARDDYLEVVLDREGRLPGFLARHATRQLDDTEVVRCLQLLELQRHALLMHTSCGWFFEELSRPEPVQVLRYAARAVQLAEYVTGTDDLEERFQELLAEAPSNEPRFGDGRGVYAQLVRPAKADLEQVAAHFAISSLSWPYGHRERIGAYEVERDDYELREAGRAKLAYGRLTVSSAVTRSRSRIEFGVLHFGDHNVVCGVRDRGGDEAYERLAAALEEQFGTADFPEVIRTIDDQLGGDRYSLRTLFLDEQRRILGTVLENTLEEIEGTYRVIYRGRAPLMRFLTDLGAHVPPALRSAAEVVLNGELAEALSSSAMDPNHVRSLLDEADRFDVVLDTAGLTRRLETTITRLARRVAASLDEDARPFLSFDDEAATGLARVDTILEVVELLPFEVDLADAQDVVWRTMRDHLAPLRERAATGDAVAARWAEELTRVAFAVHVVPPDTP
jgi:alpha-amylase/alpha-mannosidase (GH57 family)